MAVPIMTTMPFPEPRIIKTTDKDARKTVPAIACKIHRAGKSAIPFLRYSIMKPSIIGQTLN